jgi:hypothetical protein
MNKWKKILVIALTILASNALKAQDDDKACQLILQEGLYRQYKIVKTGNFHKDLKTYFSSEEFKKDYHEGNWAGKIGVVIDGIPLELGANSSEADLNEFQRKVTRSTSLTVTQSFYDYSSTSIPDVELAKVYTECVIGNRRYGFKVTPRVSEKNIFFVVNYYKNPNEREGMPKIKRFDLKGGTNVTKSFSLGDNISSETSISADRDPEKDLIMILETDRGVATYIVPAEPSGFNRDFPVGTIICSYLNWTEFQAASKNNFNNPSSSGIWTSRYSKWAPADGRQVPNSAFQKVTSQSNIPDLRGTFLRGLNQFDNDQSSQADQEKKDPDNRTRGSFQADENKTHSHTTAGEYQEYSLNGPKDLFQLLRGTGTHSTAATGGAESRPKNVAIFYYIRIN